MAMMNVKYGFMVYEDQNSNSPQIKIPDISVSIDNVEVFNDRSERGTVKPGEIKDVSITSLSLGWDNTTKIEFYRPYEHTNNMRIAHESGASTAFRTNRNVGGGIDTELTITKMNDYVARIKVTGGTPLNLANVQNSDYVKIRMTDLRVTSPFLSTNQGKEFLVQSKGVDYIDIIDNGAIFEETVVLGADFSSVFKVLSQGETRVGDIVKINNGDINPANAGKFEIIDVSDDYIEIVSPYGAEQNDISYSSDKLVIYKYLIGFVNIRANNKLLMRFDEQQEWISLDLIADSAIFMGSISSYKIQFKNTGLDTVTYSLQVMQVTAK